MIPFIIIPLSIGMGLIGLGAFLWALEHDQFNDPEDAASRILFADALVESRYRSKEDIHGQLAADAHHGDTDGRL